MFGRPDSFEANRQQMVAHQLQRRGIRAPRVLQAMQHVPRELFVSDDQVDKAYDDQALPIDCEQTISQPFIVALMTEALQVEPTSKVLEVGTGSGYQTAILAELADKVVTVERHAHLSELAKSRLERLHYTNIVFHVGDGSLGCPAEAPFDRIIITAAASQCPPALWEQLAEQGQLVGPFGGAQHQILELIRKVDGQPQRMELGGCRFVPLIAGVEG